MDLSLRTETAEDTRSLGAALAPLLRVHDVVLLTGDLGAGKTTFVQGVAKGLGATEHVASPTFTLVREYVSGRVPLAHVDVYRLDRVQDVMDLALEELEDGACALFVEWGDAVEELLSDDHLTVELVTEDPVGRSEARGIRLMPQGPSWAGRAVEIELVTHPWRTRS